MYSLRKLNIMNKKIPLSLFLLFSVSAIAQNIDYSNVRVDYIRLPLKPVSKDVVSYQPLIIADYLQKIEQQKADHQAASAKAETDYQQALKQYWTKRNQDSLLYENSLNVWFRLTPQQQAVTPRPLMPASTVPIKVISNEPVLEKTFNLDLLASINIKLEGFTKLPEKALIIQLNLSGFEKDEAKSTTQKKQIKRVDGKTIDSTVFIYQFNYRHIIKLKIIQPDGKFIMDEAYGPSLGFTTYSSKFFANQIDLDNYWNTAQASEITTTQDKIVMDNLKSINEMINSNFGYVSQTRNVVVGYVNEKKLYDDFKDALNNAKNGYAIIAKKETNGQGIDYLKKAVTIWETALKESNPSNKKARVDEDVTECLLMDLSEAYVWLNDFTKAQEYLIKLDAFKLSYKEKGIKNSTKAFWDDQNIRVAANKQD